MFRRTLLLCLAAAFTLGLDCPSDGLRLVELDPNLGRYRVEADEAVVLRFSAELDPATITPASVRLLAEGGGDPVPVAGTLGVDGDTVTFTPSAALGFGVPHRVVLGDGIASLKGDLLEGGFPAQRYGNTERAAPGDRFVVNRPNDLDDGAAGASGYDLVGYRPSNPDATDPAVPESIPGISATEAWKLSTGRPDVLIAVLDNGISDYGDRELFRAFYLNPGELPLPRDAAGRSVCDLGPCRSPHDFDGDGRLGVDDYVAAGHAIGPGGVLEAVEDRNGNGRLDADDLIRRYADGADGYAADTDVASDANELVDDISGYDFFRDVPQAYGLAGFPEGDHGQGRAREAAARANNGGDDVGTCPGCSVVVVRYSYGLLADTAPLARAIRYSLEIGADVIVTVLGAANGTPALVEALREADAAGVPVVVSPDDLSSFHHSFPSILDHTLSVKANLNSFVESPCTGYGAHVDVATTGLCSSTAAGRMAGAMGLLISRARDLGYCATSDPTNPACTRPDLGANETVQIMRATAEKPADLSRCIGLTASAPCKRVPDQHQGYGRVNLFEALASLESDPIPPAVQILGPGAYGWYDPSRTAQVTISGSVSARAAIQGIGCAWAPGLEPEEEDFRDFLCKLRPGDRFDGVLELAPVAAALGDLDGPPAGPQDDTFTVRVQVGAAGAVGQDRKPFALGRHPDAVAGFPFALLDTDDDGVEDVVVGSPLAPSLEAPPALADLDGLPGDELVIATSGGQVHSLRFAPSLGRMAERAGWPKRLVVAGGHPDVVLGAPAVGDVDGDARPDVVVATVSGALYAWSGRDGAPIGGDASGRIGRTDTPDNSTSVRFGAGAGFQSGPMLADLDGDGALDVIAAATDTQIYAVDGASLVAGSAARLAGWPVELADAGCSTIAISIVGAPVAVDLDGDDRAEILAGTSESCDEGSGRLYAVRSAGMLADGGPYLDGFPRSLPSNPLGVELPIPPISTGISGSAAAARFGGEVAIGTGTFLGPSYLLFVNLATGAVREQMLSAFPDYGVGAGGAFADGFVPGELTYAVGSLSVEGAGGGGLAKFRHRGLNWPVGGSIPARRLVLEDFLFGTHPLFADLDDAATEEAIFASGGHLVHAYRADGSEIDGFPKLTYGWHQASPALGDLDGDGLLELVAPVREGRVFAWHTRARACGGHSWPAFRHDNHRTGDLDAPGTGSCP